MKVVEFRDEEVFERLRPEWDALLRQSPSTTIFLTPEWMKAWWSAYGTPGELRLLAAYDGGALRGIAPLRTKKVRRFGQTVNALQFIGDAPKDCDSDYLDFIVARGYEADVLKTFYRHIAQEAPRNAVLLLNEIPEHSSNLAWIRDAAAARELWLEEQEVPCGTVELPSSWETYLGILKPRFRTKVRSVLRNLENAPKARFGFCESKAELERLLPALYDLHGRRWRQSGKPGVFGSSAKREFYSALSPLLLERGWLRLSWLEWNGQLLAVQYGFAYEGVYSQLQEGYEPDSEHWNTGIALRAWSIREYISQGLKEYDFLGGVGRHKSDWGARRKNSRRLTLATPTPGNALFLYGPAWNAATRGAIKKVIPAKDTRNGNGFPPMTPVASWPRRIAAKAYAHSIAPSFVRVIRNRYQLSLDPKVSCRRRLEGGARIFYYHRVNDDGDPFFAATPSRVFEAHMRYLARHYRVVSMGEVNRRLQDGDSRETVVGVTFDDGYRDNYEFAFPILQRYHIPATIFLSTGSLDSGGPLWFEVLAESIKRTGLEFLDLEFDIPRRYWLRTERERLNVNQQLFGLLRQLSDSERRTRLTEILQRLGAPKQSERREKMLTWDQVRGMKAAGIDFGGHTVTHPFLSKLPPDRVQWEVSECKRRIEEECQSEVGFFAYPNGREEDFAASNKHALRTAGYQAAVTTVWGMNYCTTDPMELKRGGPWEDDPALFALKLDWYQLANE